MKILLIDDHKLFAKSIQLLCQQYDEVDVIDTITSNFNDVTIDLSKYDIILLDNKYFQREWIGDSRGTHTVYS